MAAAAGVGAGDAPITTMDQIVEGLVREQRMGSHMLEIFRGPALLLSVGGLYAMLGIRGDDRTRRNGG